MARNRDESRRAVLRELDRRLAQKDRQKDEERRPISPKTTKTRDRER
jgi:hypothetical protein